MFAASVRAQLSSLRQKDIYSLLHSEWRVMIAVISMMIPCCLIFFDDTVFKPYELYFLYAAILTILIALPFRRQLPIITSVIVLPMAIGLGASAIRLMAIPETSIQKVTHTYITATVAEVTDREGGSVSMTVTLEEAVTGLQVGNQIKLIARTPVPDDMRLGSRIGLKAVLEPLRGALVPDGYNFERANRQNGIVAAGYSVSEVSLLEENRAGSTGGLQAARKAIEEEILAALPGQTGAVAVALTVGYRGHLSYETQENLKRAGLSHLLAISGLHMGLVTGGIFFLFELLFAAIPAIALRVMPKKLAVLPAWLGGLVYLFLSGASVSTLRAFIMVSVAMIAILTDRRVLSLRSVAFAVMLILLIRPESVLSIGFQMSFAATAGLVAFYEAWTEYKRKKGHHENQRGFVKRCATFIAGIAVTSLVAQVSVAIFSLYHFQEISLIAIIGNLLVLPIVSLILMPLLLLGIVLPWNLIAYAIEVPLQVILSLAEWLAGVDHAMVHTGHVTDWAFITSSLLFFSILLFPRRKVTLSLTAVIVLVLVIGRQAPPDILISESGKLIVQQKDGDLYEWGLRAGSFRDRVWRQYLAIDYKADAKNMERTCDIGACRYNTNIPISHVDYIEGVYEACSMGDIVILPRRYKRYCKGASLLLTKEELAKYGPVAIWLHKKGGLAIQWSNPPKAKVPEN